jgi:hypothetical protein
MGARKEVIPVPTEMLTRPEQQASPVLVPTADDELQALTQRQTKRVRRLKINVAAWGAGTLVLTAGWVAHEWQANGSFQRFAHEGNPGDWNPTLWALVVLLWGFAVGIMALRAYFERPATTADVEREVDRFTPWARGERAPADAGLRHQARARLERIARLRFHVAAWVLGMIMLTPLNALIEWQDNGGFQRFSRNSQPGSWDPWILIIGGIWALVIIVFYAVPVFLDRRRKTVDDSDLKRLTPSH